MQKNQKHKLKCVKKIHNHSVELDNYDSAVFQVDAMAHVFLSQGLYMLKCNNNVMHFVHYNDHDDDFNNSM